MAWKAEVYQLMGQSGIRNRMTGSIHEIKIEQSVIAYCFVYAQGAQYAKRNGHHFFRRMIRNRDGGHFLGSNGLWCLE